MGVPARFPYSTRTAMTCWTPLRWERDRGGSGYRPMGDSCSAPMGLPTTFRSSILRPTEKSAVSRPGPVPGASPSLPDDEYFLLGDAAGETILEGPSTQHRRSAQFDGLFVARIRCARHGAVQGIAYVSLRLVHAQGNLYGLGEASSGRRDRWRRHYRAPGHAVDPLTEEVDAFLIDGFASQRRHPDLTHGIDAHIGNRTPDVMRCDDSRTVYPLVDQDGAVDQRLVGQGSVIACIEIRHRSARPVTL